jgi:hypothetical protein
VPREELVQAHLEALAVDAIIWYVLSWRGPRPTKLLDLVHGETTSCFPQRVEIATQLQRNVGASTYNASKDQ